MTTTKSGQFAGIIHLREKVKQTNKHLFFAENTDGEVKQEPQTADARGVSEQ